MELVFWLTRKLSWKKWAEHFDGVLNRPSSINDEAINRLPQVECNPLLDEFPTVSETVKAIKPLSSGKAPGSDAIPAEIYKVGGPPVAVISHHVEKRSHPSRIQGCNNYPPTHVFKRKGNPKVCDNHRGISLLSIAGKILARVLLNRLNEHLEQSGLLPKNQCGFRKDRETIDMIFTAGQLQEKCQEQNVDLYMTSVDLTIAFDTGSHEGLWKIMAKFGCPAEYLGVQITDDLEWGQHINEITSKAIKTLGFLRRNMAFAPRETKAAAYTILVRLNLNMQHLFGCPIIKRKLIE